MKTLLGLDPGLAKVGWGVVRVAGNRHLYVAHGVIRTAAETAAGERLLAIHQALARLLEEHHPTGAGVETLFFARNTSSAMRVAEARGVLLLCLSEYGVPIHEYSPLQVKQALLGRGSGRAEKRQVQQMVRMLLGLQEIPRPYDAADALALAVCCAHETEGVEVLAAAERNWPR